VSTVAVSATGEPEERRLRSSVARRDSSGEPADIVRGTARRLGLRTGELAGAELHDLAVAHHGDLQ